MFWIEHPPPKFSTHGEFSTTKKLWIYRKLWIRRSLSSLSSRLSLQKLHMLPKNIIIVYKQKRSLDRPSCPESSGRSLGCNQPAAWCSYPQTPPGVHAGPSPPAERRGGTKRVFTMTDTSTSLIPPTLPFPVKHHWTTQDIFKWSHMGTVVPWTTCK